MKKLLPIPFFLLLILAFACNNTENSESKEARNQTIEQHRPQTIELAQVKDGDKIGDFRVEEINYKQNDSYLIKLLGDFNITGKVERSAMDGVLSIKASESVLPAKLRFQDIMLSTDYIEFRNEDNLKKALSDQQWKQIRDGKSISLTVRVKDFHSMGKFQSEYMNSVEFVKVLK